MSDKLAFSIEEIVKAGPAGRTTIYQEIKDGRLKAKKLGRRTIVLRHNYIDWLEALPDRLPGKDTSASMDFPDDDGEAV